MNEIEANLEAAKYAADFVSRNSQAFTKIWDSLKVKAKINMERTYLKYLETSCAHYARTKPSIFGAEPIPIYDFYVPLDVKLGQDDLIESVGFQSLVGMLPQGRAVISGTAGGGKSMLMRHLFVSAQRQGHQVPVFVELRKANKDKTPLKSMIANALQLFKLDVGSNIDVFVEQALQRGHLALVLDGYDEVDPDHKEQLTEELLKLSAEAPDCIIVISTRPDISTQGWDDFSNFNLQCLTKTQAVQVVSKLPYDKAVKKSFSAELDASLYDKHFEFLSNPLLLVIMLVTYSRSSEIPESLNEFYSQAFGALFYHHDTSKEVYKRKRHCELGIQSFSKLFSAFCMRTYAQSKFESTRMEALEHIEKAKGNVGVELNNEDFLHDMQSSVCLLVQDGLSLVFAHRSFQEYFTAKFILGCDHKKQKVLLEKVFTH